MWDKALTGLCCSEGSGLCCSEGFWKDGAKKSHYKMQGHTGLEQMSPEAGLVTHHYEYWVLSAGGGRDGSIVFDWGSHECDLSFLLMDTQKYSRFICPAPRSSQEPAAKLVPKPKKLHFQTGAFQALQMANWQRPALSDLGEGRARPLPSALLHIVGVQSFLTPSPPDSPSFGLQEVI